MRQLRTAWVPHSAICGPVVEIGRTADAQQLICAQQVEQGRPNAVHVVISPRRRSVRPAVVRIWVWVLSSYSVTSAILDTFAGTQRVFLFTSGTGLMSIPHNGD
jgi:hypothetical protein